MASGAELGQRLDRLARAIPIPDPDFTSVARGARIRRFRSALAVAVSLILVASLFATSLVILSSHGGRLAAGFSVDQGRLRSSVVQFGDEVTYPSDWTLLLLDQDADLPPPIPVYQLTNFDPGVIGPDAAGSWLCPLHPRRIPDDGVVLVV